MRYRSLYSIAFDNSGRLSVRTQYFQYRGFAFKLVQDNPRKWADHLLTIVDDEAASAQAFRTAAEFLSALAWENRSRVALWETAYRSWPLPLSLKDARAWSFSPPKISFRGMSVGYDLLRIPLVETDLQRTALALFREARASNNDYLSFLFHWQVLEVAGAQAVDVVNAAFRRERDALGLSGDDLARLPLKGRSLGNYLLEDCRHAIAHLRRRRGSTRLDIDDPADRTKIALSVRVAEALARYFIQHHLKLSKTMYLRQLKRGEFPIYLDSTDARGRYLRRSA